MNTQEPIRFFSFEKRDGKVYPHISGEMAYYFFVTHGVPVENYIDMMKAFSTFSGIGGFDLALERSGITVVGHSEVDKFAERIYRFKFNNPNYGNITTINANELPDFDLLVGGFPCQAFSIAGKRGGFSDSRGGLFFDLARILQAKRPQCFLFENVKGLLSHDGGKTFATVIQTLTKLGYSLEWQVLNSKNFGVPQNRERVFIVGYFGDIPRQKIFPLPRANGRITPTGIVPVLTPDRPQKRHLRTVQRLGHQLSPYL